MLTIFIEDSFDAAHHLPHVPKGHKCRNLHGHTYRIRIEIGGTVDELLGWIVDYSDVKRAWDLAKVCLDHRNLNEMIPNPTCELISEWIAAHVKETLPKQAILRRIELRETERCGVIWEDR